MTLGFRGLAAFVCGACGLWIAWAHPIMPGVAALSFALWAGLVSRWPRAWLFGVPALLPLANFSPWTGWIVVEEFDLVLLGAAAGAYTRSVIDAVSRGCGDQPPVSAAGSGLLLVLGASNLISLAIGLADAGHLEMDWFASYGDPLNGVRVSKSLFFALLFLPLVADSARRPGARPVQSFGTGVAAGLALVGLAVLWERAAFAGVFDFQRYYRATALFWEMHVGGAALDAYLVLAFPFAVFAWVLARDRLARAGAGLSALLAIYASLATLSRGLFVALAGLLLIALFLHARRHAPLLKSALLFFGGVALFTGTAFLPQRFDGADRDLSGRLAHWRAGAALLRSPGDWIFGLGLGRFPAAYTGHTPAVEWPGAYRWVADAHKGSGGAYVQLAGPPSHEHIAGVFGISQRVNVAPGRHMVTFDARSTDAAGLAVSLCERHLIYEAACTEQIVSVPAGDQWHTIRVTLDAGELTGGPWYAPRLAFFKLAVDDAGRVVGLRNVGMTDRGGRELIANGRFMHGTARWILTGRYYFLPWHIDNLLLELLIERGLSGLALVVATLAVALRAIAATTGTAGRCIASSLAGFCVVGMFGSALDVPRVAFLFWILLVFALTPGACGAPAAGGREYAAD